MIKLTFGKMRKRPNSTKQDIEDAKIVENVCLKEGVDVKAPTFKVNFDTSAYNYVIWGDRYYYIDNTIYVNNGLWEINCSLDILATYKNLIRHGTTGKLLYCTKESYWDLEYDDLRFSPHHLSWHGKTGLLDPHALDWLSEHDNVFGEYNFIGTPKLWDATYNDEGTVTAYGDGCYILQTISGGSGTHNYVMDRATFNGFFEAAFGNIGSLFTDKKSYIQIANWLPINFDYLRRELPDDKWCTRVYIGAIDYVDLAEGRKCIELPQTLILGFDGSMPIPYDKDEHPVWMENSRWNKLILQTPSGNVDLNLDMIYPITKSKWAGGRHPNLSWHTTFDVISGTIDTKYMADSKSFNTLGGTILYESIFNIATDVMNLIQKTYNPLQLGVAVGSGVAMTAGAAMVGGAVAGAAVAPKVKRIKTKGLTGEQRKSAKALNKMITDYNDTFPSTEDTTGIGQVVSAISPKVQLTPNINQSSSAFQLNSSFVSLINNNQLGGITLRLKVFRCKELHQGYESYYEGYIEYCKQYGFPVNEFYDKASLEKNHFYVFENPMLSPDYSYARVDGLTDEEQTAILNSLSSGIWME